jgi:hypothetical protein
MTNLTETSSFDAGVYQIATTDAAIGGAVLAGPSGGIANFAAQNLTNRTRWLYDQVNAISASVAGLAPINSPVFTGTPRCPTPAGGDNSLSLANTSWVRALLGTASLSFPGWTTDGHGVITQFVNIIFRNGLAAGGLQTAIVVALPTPFPNGYLGGFAQDSGLAPQFNYGVYPVIPGSGPITQINATCQNLFINDSSGGISSRSNDLGSCSGIAVVFGW